MDKPFFDEEWMVLTLASLLEIADKESVSCTFQIVQSKDGFYEQETGIACHQANIQVQARMQPWLNVSLSHGFGVNLSRGRLVQKRKHGCN